MLTTIMVVDDDTAVAQGIAAVLESNGFDTAVVASAEEALAAIDQVHPDGLILDINLPGLSGLELYKELERTHGAVPAIFASGREDLSIVKQHGFSSRVGFLRKPFTAEAMFELLADLGVGNSTSGEAPNQRPRLEPRS